MSTRIRPVVILLLAWGALSPELSFSADWPHWRGPSHNGISSETVSASNPSLNVAWEVAIGRGYSGIAVASGRAYTLGHDGAERETVYCFDAKTGETLWTHDYPAGLMPTAHPGGPNAMPTVDGDRVYTVSKDGQLFCFNAADGAVQWQKKLPELVGFELPTWGIGSAPLIDGDGLILSGAKTFALDKNTGEVLWQSDAASQPGYATPARFQANDQDLLACLFGKSIDVVSAADGTLLASAPFEAQHDMTAATPVIIDAGAGRFFVSANTRGRMVRYEQGNLITEWESETMKATLNTCVLLDGHLYGFSGGRDNSSLVCIRASDGALAWSEQGMGGGALIAAGDRLLALSEEGEVVIAEATSDAFRPIARKQVLEKTCWTPPSLADGRLYIRNDRGRLACVDLGE